MTNLANILPMPELVERKCMECNRKFRVLEKSKQQCCCRYCEYEFVRRVGDRKRFLDLLKDSQVVRTIPRNANVLKLNFGVKK